MKIDKRLQKISEFISDNSFILDVGCDHALLDIYVCLNKKNVFAIASDINSKPLEKAKENINKYKLNKKITIIQEDGLKGINKKIDTIIISGMGAILITDILKKDYNLLNNIKRLILCPNNEEELVRKEINQLGFKIIDEDLVEDKNIIYPIIVFEKGKEKLSKKQINYGPILLIKKGNLYKKYYLKKLNTYKKILKRLPNKYIIKKIILNKKIRELIKIL